MERRETASRSPRAEPAVAHALPATGRSCPLHRVLTSTTTPQANKPVSPPKRICSCTCPQFVAYRPAGGFANLRAKIRIGTERSCKATEKATTERIDLA